MNNTNEGRVVASHLLLRRQESLLLSRRFHTGWEDGKYSVVAGHVNPDESPVLAMIREAREEAGIRIDAENLEFAHVMHRRKAHGEVKVDIWFSCDTWEGTPHNAEPHKCDDLRWFTWNSLPTNLVEYVRTALLLIRDECKFSAYCDRSLLLFSGIDSRVRRVSTPSYNL